MTAEYKTLTFVKNVIETKFVMPPGGKLIMFGVEDGNGSIQRLCSTWGPDRVIGYDIEKRQHPNTRQLDLARIGTEQACKISFADLDVGDWHNHADLRLALLHWCVPLMVPNGLIMTTAPLANQSVWRERGHPWMIQRGFTCHGFDAYDHEPWHRRMTREGTWNPNATCVYRRGT